MSFLTKLFGGGKSGAKAPTPAEAIQRLREVEEMLMKKQEFLERKVEQELQTAKKNGTKNKRVALQALKRKKRYEKQLTQIDGTLTTIEYQREALENANTNTEVLKIMGLAAKALKNAHEMDVDQVHDLMDEVQEQQEIANEISDAISNPVGFDRDFDEDELARELEELEQEELDEQLIAVGPPAEELPSVPTAEPSRPAKAKPVEEDDDEMKELAAWAS
ncbi:charged multivesicular body protein 4b [Caerostris extrusa]|uniref:Charged multivesicular body protein 4b n=1 Tax=Caerostris extrusa TaxID=172846 RepID=A0AAV4R717_CAEEX|nr:charged multivesicular body protein 4b [Caerostris extrusa]